MLKLVTLVSMFLKDRRGVALTEYLILLGLLTAAVVVAVILFGNNLATAWNDWAVWIGSYINTPS